MQAERWTQVEELFHAALAQAPERRAQFLAETCPDDRELREEVQSLLDSGDDAFLEDAPAGAQESFERGYKLSHFEILEPIGRGGMGHVYRARDLRLEREVAIKVLPLDFARDPRRIVRFEREARAASALNHPNIVQIYQTGQQEGVYWIVSELVHGSTLREAIKGAPFPVRKAVAIAIQVANALAAAHTSGIIHRDLNPSNIMLTGDNRAKILDFGLAKQTDTASFTDNDSSATVTIPGLIFGTPGYLAPEQIRGYGSDHRSDIFALGVMLQEMLSGKRVFEGSSTVEVLNATVKNEPRELPSSVSPSLQRIVQRCLEKDPDKRFQSAADLSFALESLVEPVIPIPVPKQRSRKWLAYVSMAAAIVAAGAYWLGSRASETSAPSYSVMTRLTTESGLSTDGAISSDGKLAAFASDRAGLENLDIWVKQIDSAAVPVRLTTDPADDYDPEFSPDGTEIAYRSERAGGGIYTVPTLGGDSRLIVPLGRRPRYSPDGKALLYWTGMGTRSDPNGEAAVKLFVQPVNGGSPTEVGAGCTHVYASAVWSPDSRRVLFQGTCRNQLTLWIFNADDTRLQPSNQLFTYLLSNHFRVSNEFHNPLFVFHEWAGNPSRLLASHRTGDEESIAAVPISEDGFRVTGAVQYLTFGAADEGRASVAANGRIVLSSVRMSPQVWGLPVTANGRAAGEPKPLAGENSGAPSLSKDGRMLAVRFNTSRTWELRSVDLATGKQIIVGAGPGTAEHAINATGTTIAYALAHKNELVLWQVSSAGGLPRKLFEGDFDVIDWSPDSRLLLGVDGAESTSIRILDVFTGKLTDFLHEAGHAVWQTHFSNDMRWVAFNCVEAGHSQLFIAPFRMGSVPRSEWIAITGPGGWDDKPHFSSNSRILFFTSDRDGYRCIWAQRLAPDMHPSDDPYPVYHSHRSQRCIGNVALGLLEISIGPRLIAFDQMAFAGDIWLLQPEKPKKVF